MLLVVPVLQEYDCALRDLYRHDFLHDPYLLHDFLSLGAPASCQ